MEGAAGRPTGGAGASRGGPGDGARGSGGWARLPGVVLLLCLSVAFGVYWPALGNGFYNDDALFLNHAGRVLDEPAAALTDRPLGYFRPTWSAYVAAQRAVFGLAPAGYFVVGVALHGLTGFLVWLLARRLLARSGPWPPLAAAVGFLCLFAHSEAVLWIAAHNSVLAAGLCLLAALLNLRVAEAGRARAAGFAPGPALATALVALAALWAKEPSVVVLAWLPIVEAAVHGPRSLLGRAALVRYGLVALAAAVFVLGNGRVGEAFADPAAAGAAGAPAELRATFAFATVDRVLGATAWMLSPLRHVHEQARWWHGALLLGGALALVAARRRDLLPAALAACGLALTAMLPASMTRLQQVNSSRLYYFPTVGAALLLGLVVAALGSRAPRAVRLAIAALVLAGCAWHVSAVRGLQARDYGPLSRFQTRLAEQLGGGLESVGPHAVYLLEPWIGNVMHMQEFAQLYAGVAPRRVTRMAVAREAFPAWAQRQRQLDPGAALLDWDDEAGLVPATGPPPRRNDAPGWPRRAAELGVEQRIAVLRIAPP